MAAFFEIIHDSKSSLARTGIIHTTHGDIPTPAFIPVATNGAIKSCNFSSIRETSISLIFCNTYHLLIHPGTTTISQAGGLHSFISWPKPIITDSGGFQILSLSKQPCQELKRHKQKSSSQIHLSEEGVLFTSYRDGQKILLTPENSITAQKAFASDIILPLDQLYPGNLPEDQSRISFERTHRWQLRSIATHQNNPAGQGIYPIIHGGQDLEARKLSCKILREHPCQGFAIGGSLGTTQHSMLKIVEQVVASLPRKAPLHLLGIGDKKSIREALSLGVDTFDSSYPTRAARHGIALTHSSFLKLRHKHYLNDFRPIEKNCPCTTCKTHTRAYLHHLFKAKELSALTLTTLHNLFSMESWMQQQRESISRNEL